MFKSRVISERSFTRDRTFENIIVGLSPFKQAGPGTEPALSGPTLGCKIVYTIGPPPS